MKASDRWRSHETDGWTDGCTLTHHRSANLAVDPHLPVPSIRPSYILSHWGDVDADGWSDGDEVFFRTKLRIGELVSPLVGSSTALLPHTHHLSPQAPARAHRYFSSPRCPPLLPSVVLVLHQHNLSVNSDLDTRSVILVRQTAALALGADAALVLSMDITVPSALRL